MYAFPVQPLARSHRHVDPQQSSYVSFLYVIGFYTSSMADNFLKLFTIVLISIPTTIPIVQSIGKELRVMHTGSYGVFTFLFSCCLFMLQW